MKKDYIDINLRDRQALEEADFVFYSVTTEYTLTMLGKQYWIKECWNSALDRTQYTVTNTKDELITNHLEIFKVLDYFFSLQVKYESLKGGK